MSNTLPQTPYTPSQLSAYLAHISFPSPSPLPPPSLSFLTRLLTYHLSTVPFENTKLHYSTLPSTPLPPHTQLRTPTLEPAALYTNIVERGRGGYCVELNAFFGYVLRGLGFVARPRGAKVHASVDASRAGDWFQGWTHMVNVVSVPGDEGREWLVDVGFGGRGPWWPVPVDYAEGAQPEVVRGVGEMVCRVRRFGVDVGEGREGVEDPGQKEQMRVFETRVEGKEERWAPLYAFTRHLAFDGRDYELMNWCVATQPDSWFTRKMVCIKFVREGEELVGAMILDGDTFTRRIRGEKEVLLQCQTEEERVDGLRRWLNIEFSKDEVKEITGLSSALSP
ncbi:MAG: N-terminal acetyltransferase [Bathelium mastoideum]|nr:MAG: N-terminal acetyltransferase [Bathelium mastoideum]